MSFFLSIPLFLYLSSSPFGFLLFSPPPLYPSLSCSTPPPLPPSHPQLLQESTLRPPHLPQRFILQLPLRADIQSKATGLHQWRERILRSAQSSFPLSQTRILRFSPSSIIIIFVSIIAQVVVNEIIISTLPLPFSPSSFCFSLLTRWKCTQVWSFHS